MTDETSGTDDQKRSRVARSLEKFPRWSRTGRHQAIADEADRLLADIEDRVQLRATVLMWKAQAHLAMGSAELALPPASTSCSMYSKVPRAGEVGL